MLFYFYQEKANCYLSNSVGEWLERQGKPSAAAGSKAEIRPGSCALRSHTVLGPFIGQRFSEEENAMAYTKEQTQIFESFHSFQAPILIVE